ncbi:MAG: hypothetical protein EOP83_00465 [Verrucomicrobiaceae bacterium]|nr:MAG: hypothetical protein EOP83_00465 [Verrucomicrobiaceae bacterium]
MGELDRVAEWCGVAVERRGLYDPSAEDVLNHWSFETKNERTWFPKAVTREGKVVTVAYWVVVLALLVVWTAFLAWRWRRMRRPVI